MQTASRTLRITLALALGLLALEPRAATSAGNDEPATRVVEEFKKFRDHPKKSPEEVLRIHREFLQLWGERAPEFKSRFLGVRTLQTPTDAWIIQEIISETKPDFVIETGTFHGGSAMMWAMILEQVNPKGRVITIDIEDKREKRAVEHPLSKRKVDFLLGGSTDPKIVDEVKRRVGKGKVLVILDSLHTKEHVLAELRAYSPLVHVGEYLIVQDTLIESYKAVGQFLAENEQFKHDQSRVRFMITNSGGGYLRRLR